MSTAFEDLKRLLSSTDGTLRKSLLGQLYEIIASVETPEETATRIALYPLQTSAARIGHDLKIFQILDSSGPKSLAELQNITNAHPLSLGRILRYMASVGLIRESDTNVFEANKKCRNLAAPEAVTIVTHFFENCGPLFQEMPAFLRKKGYQDVTDGRDTVFQPAYNTNLDTYTWFSQNPQNRAALINYMEMEQKVRGRWLDVFPLQKYVQNWDAKLPVFVDVGGNIGYYCAMFQNHFPKLPGRIVLQDLPATLAQALPTPGVELQEHDFFNIQPVKGAKFYHLGWVLHNWNDEMAKQILRQIRLSMTSQSIILINDMILPEKGVPAFAASLDLVMLGACGSRERTMHELTDILKEVGLAIRECIVYNKDLCHGILAVVLA